MTVREILYAALYELLLDALTAEHGMRLLAAQSAGRWLEDEMAMVHRRLVAGRREATTQEVLDIVCGVRVARHGAGRRRTRRGTEGDEHGRRAGGHRENLPRFAENA